MINKSNKDDDKQQQKEECKHEYVCGPYNYGRNFGYQCRFCGKVEDKKK